MEDFINMDGYGLYVWSAYGAALAILLFIILKTALRQYQLLKQEREFEDRNKLPDL